MFRRTLFGALLTVVAAGAAPAVAADQPAPTWNCRASLLQVFGSTPEPRLEPLVANGDGTTGADRAFCADDAAGLPQLASPEGSPLNVVAQGPMVATDVTPDTGAARDQTATAGTKVADVAVSTPGGELAITAKAIQSQAVARCVNGVPSLTGSSTVVDLKVNGQALPVDDNVISQITQSISDSPLGGIIKVRVDQKVADATSLTVQAVRIELFSAAGSPQGTIVLGASKVARTGDTCAPAAPADNGTTTATGTNGANGSNGANGADGASTTTTTPAPAPAAAPAPATTGGSSTTVLKKVVLNGRNGGCGHLKVWFEKVDLLHRLPGSPMKTTSRFGNRVMVRGQLISCSGKPIVGARIAQVHYVGKGVGRLLKTGVRTRGNGRFTYIEPLNLTTRSIAFVYRGNLASQAVTSRKVLRLIVRNREGKVVAGKPPRTLE